jgi:transcription elongation factor GreA
MINSLSRQLSDQKKLFMTKSGLDNLKQRLDALMRDRLEAVSRLRTIDQEDRTDPFTLANEVRRLEAAEVEAADINNILQRVEPVIKPQSPLVVQIGSDVTLERDSKQVSYTIVCPIEVDIEANKISQDSPLGRTVLGRKLHETVVVPMPKGKEQRYKIISIQ